MSERIIECGDGVVKCRTCAWSPPGDHPVGCGMYLTVKDGKVVDVEGDPDHPITQGPPVRALPHGFPEYMYQREARSCSPLKRAREDRGQGRLGAHYLGRGARHHHRTVAGELRQGARHWGAESIVAFQGTGREATLRYKTPLAYAALGTRERRASP